jgi:hypothetical protein
VAKLIYKKEDRLILSSFPKSCSNLSVFLPADIWFLGNLLSAKNNYSQNRNTRFILVRAPEKRVKALRPVAIFVFLYSARLLFTM